METKQNAIEKVVGIALDMHYASSEEDLEAGAKEIPEAIAEVLRDFAEYAHTRYEGCSYDVTWKYQYDTEVVCMIDDYLNSLNENTTT